MANVIVTQLRDEENFLVDFVVHHLAIGFDKIVLVDDLSAIPVQETISTLPAELQSKVECHRLATDFYAWPAERDSKYFDEALYKNWNRSKQMYVLNWSIANLLHPADWLAVTDVDEFLWLGTYQSISEYRAEIEKRGFLAVILTMLLYGHSYHLTPPKDNNLCAFLWRASNYFGHGKYFAQVGALNGIPTPHYPSMREQGTVCDRNFLPRTTEYDWNRPKVPDFMQPHLKHYTVQDVYTCFRRRIRTRISQREPMTPQTAPWLDRMEMLKSTSVEIDCTMAASIIMSRTRAKLDISRHARALADELERAQRMDGLATTLDFDFLRRSMGYDPSTTDSAALFNFVSQENPDTSMLRFQTLPADFVHDTYRSLYKDLRRMSNRQLELHYFNYGSKEGRPYRVAETRQIGEPVAPQPQEEPTLATPLLTLATPPIVTPFQVLVRRLAAWRGRHRSVR